MASTTVTVSTTTKVESTIRFDPNYAKTIPGILKIAEVLISLMGFICIQTLTNAYISSAVGWYNFVSMTAFWVTLIMLMGYLFHIIERMHFVPWLLGELGFSALWAVFFFIAACVVVAKASLDAGYAAAAFFGFVAMGLFGYEAFIKFKGWRAGDIAQGERTVTSNASNTTSPTGPSYPTY